MYAESSCFIHHCPTRVNGYNQFNVCECGDYICLCDLSVYLCICFSESIFHCMCLWLNEDFLQFSLEQLSACNVLFFCRCRLLFWEKTAWGRQVIGLIPSPPQRWLWERGRQKERQSMCQHFVSGCLHQIALVFTQMEMNKQMWGGCVCEDTSREREWRAS